MKVGKSLQDIRKEHGLSQEEFGKMFHVTRQTVSNWENEKSYPDLQTLIEISNVFEISLDRLMKEDPVIAQKIDENRRKVSNMTLILVGFLPFVTGMITALWDRCVPYRVAGIIPHTILLLMWGLACYKVVCPERNLFVQVGMLNVGGIFSLVESVLVQLEIMEPLRCGKMLINRYLSHAQLYPWSAYVAKINKSISLVNAGVVDALDWNEGAIPKTVYIMAIAWLIMLCISVLASVLKVKGYRLGVKISRSEK